MSCAVREALAPAVRARFLTIGEPQAKTERFRRSLGVTLENQEQNPNPLIYIWDPGFCFA